MDENDISINTRWEAEFHPPAPDGEYPQPVRDREYPQPAPETEFTPPASEERQGAPAWEDRKPESGRRKLKKLIRYVAAVAVAAALIPETPPAPPELVEIESYIEIECAAVTPEAPGFLRFQYMDYRSVYEDVPTYAEEDFHFYLVRPDGSETELKKWRDPVFYRAVYCPEELDIREAAYSGVETPGSYYNLNVGCEMWYARIGDFEEGSLLKIVCEYLDEEEGVIKRMESSREIVELPETPSCTASITAEPIGDGLSMAEFWAVFHQEDDYEYVFGDKTFSTMGFCTRWYDADGRFLQEGWCFAAPEDMEWPFPDVYLSGRDFVFLYRGPVRSSATDPAAAYYSVELMITDEHTGWHYLFESERIPVEGTE